MLEIHTHTQRIWRTMHTHTHTHPKGTRKTLKIGSKAANCNERPSTSSSWPEVEEIFFFSIRFFLLPVVEAGTIKSHIFTSFFTYFCCLARNLTMAKTMHVCSWGWNGGCSGVFVVTFNSVSAFWARTTYVCHSQVAYVYACTKAIEPVPLPFLHCFVQLGRFTFVFAVSHFSGEEFMPRQVVVVP